MCFSVLNMIIPARAGQKPGGLGIGPPESHVGGGAKGFELSQEVEHLFPVPPGQRPRSGISPTLVFYSPGPV
jgi:hypothetical protein